MQGIYTYIPETNYVPREYIVAAILLVSVLNLLYFYIRSFRSKCAVPNMAVFCSSLTSYFPGMLLTYFLNDFEIIPVASITIGITFVFTFHMRCISISSSTSFYYLYCPLSTYNRLTIPYTYLQHNFICRNLFRFSSWFPLHISMMVYTSNHPVPLLTGRLEDRMV